MVKVVISHISSELVQDLNADIVDGCNDFIKLGFIACSLELVALFLEFSEIFIEVVVARLTEFLRLSQQDFDDSLNEIIS